MKVTNKPKLKAISYSKTNFGYCINSYNGCEHGCRYCYGMKVTRKKYADWVKPAPRLQLIDWLQKDMKTIKQHPEIKSGIKDIMVSSITDCYQPIESHHRITREVVKILIENELPFTVLTKNVNVLEDIDLFASYDKCIVGLTVATLDDDIRQSLEPNAPPINDRIDALKELKQAGIYTYCSVEPILPGSNPIDIIDTLKEYVDLFEFGKLNGNKGAVSNEQYYVNAFKQIESHCKANGINYRHASHSYIFLKQNGLSIRR